MFSSKAKKKNAFGYFSFNLRKYRQQLTLLSLRKRITLCFECALNKSNDNDSLKPNDSVICSEFIKKLIFTNS